MQRCSSTTIEQFGSQGAGLGCRLAALAATNAISVAVLYLGQVLAKILSRDFPADNGCMLLIPGATLGGYAIGVGIIAFVPSGRIGLSITAHVGVLSAALCAAGLAPTANTLVMASLAIGAGAAVAQRLLATAGRLGGITHGGTFIGRTVCIALTAVLGLRIAGDSFAEVVGWRTIFLAAAATAAVFGLLNHWLLLGQAPSRPSSLPPPTVISGLIGPLWRRSALLRWATFQHGAMFAVYNVAWMTILVEVSAQERMIVVFGGGGAGIVAALLAGYCVDRFTQVDFACVGVGAVAIAAALLLPLAYTLPPGLERTLGLLPGMALLDGGLQVALIANQARVQLLLPEARPRLAALLTVCGSLCGAAGAGGGYWCWHRFGWQAAISLAAVFGQIAFGCALLARSKRLNNRIAPINQGQLTRNAAVTRPAVLRGLCRLASPMSVRKKSRKA